MSENKEMVRGTFLITFSILITKILGVLFVIPFYAIMGANAEEKLAPFNYAYVPYNIAIAVATAGVPLAASKFVAKYNAIGAYRVGQKLYKSSFIVMSISGIIGFLILFYLAPDIAVITLGQKEGKGGWTVPEITWIIRIISIVVVFIPLLATWRGVFQGYQSMGPTAVSEVTEQLARIIFILIGSYLVLNVFHGTYLQANGVATFAAAVGAIAGLFTLWYYWKKRKPHIQKMVESDRTGLDISYGRMYKEIIAYSIPFVIVSLNFPLFNLVDQFTHNNALDAAGFHANKDYFFTILNFTTNKIVMIPTSLAAGFAVSLIPFITKTYAEGRLTEMHRQIKTSIGVLIFYQYNPDGNKMLFIYAPVAILISLLSVTASMLQGIDKQKLTVFVILGSVVLKLALNIPLIMTFHTAGAILSTAIALSFAITANFFILKIYAKYEFTETFVQVAKIFIYSLIMMISVEIVYLILAHFVPVERKFGAMIILLVGVIVGALVYGSITIKNRLADQFLGELPEKIRRKVGFLR